MDTASIKVQVQYDFLAQPGSQELSVSVGEFLTVTRQNVGDGWWEGINAQGEHGLFPEAYVKVVSSSPPPVPPPPLPVGYAPSVVGQSTSVPPSTNGGTASPGPRQQGASSYLNNQLEEFEDDWSDESQSQPDTNDDEPRAASRSVDSALNRERSKRSISRFNKFVKSGTENFVLNAIKTSQPVTEKFEITDSANGIEWVVDRQTDYCCQVASPQKASKLKGLKSFMTYQLTPTFSGIQVCRRYKHFDWLHEQLIGKFTVMLIPPLPEKQVAGRYEEEFVEHRMQLLQLWVTKICRHPVLSRCEVWMHFLTCTEEKKWKQGKRKAEKDEYRDGNFFYTICCPNRHLDPLQTESNIENFARMARTMESALRSFNAVAQEQAKRMVGCYKRECQKFSCAFHELGLSFDLDQSEQCRPVAVALQKTADCYDAISQMYESVPKRYLETLMDNFFVYKGMLGLVGDAVQVHKSANAKVREHQKLVEERRATLEDADLVRSRAEVIDYTILAEFNHFRNECVADIGAVMVQFLHGQIAFHEAIVDRLREAASHYQN